MSQMPPRVSVGLPVYNGEVFLAEAIESILAQTMTDLELVISDNASTDATERICRDYLSRDPRVRYQRNTLNVGANANFNRVVELSNQQSVYFSWCAHDDIWAPSFLERCIQVLDANPTAVLCHTKTRLINTHGVSLSSAGAIVDGVPVAPQDPPRQLDSVFPQKRLTEILLRTRWCFEIFGVMRRSALTQTSLQEDYYGTDKVIRAALALAGPMHQVPEELFLRRCHVGQSTAITSAAARAIWSNPKARRAPLIP